jgi:hypothetical protein
MQYPDLKEIERRPKKYWNADGVPELVMGAMWVLWGAAIALPTWLHLGNWIWLVLIFSGLAANPAIKKLKQHFTFPRTGYVEWKPQSGLTKAAMACLGAGVAAAFLFLIRTAKVQGFMDLLPTGCALFFALLFLITATWHKLPHHLWISALSLVLAFIIIHSQMDLTSSFILLWLSLGVCLIVLGGIRLRAYLHGNPRRQEDEA